jgi:hypothetical protein
MLEIWPICWEYGKVGFGSRCEIRIVLCRNLLPAEIVGIVGGQDSCLVQIVLLRSYVGLYWIFENGRGADVDLVSYEEQDVIPHVLPYSWTVSNDANVVPGLFILGTNTTDYKQLRRLEGACGKYDFSGGTKKVRYPITLDHNACCSVVAVKHDLFTHSMDVDCQVWIQPTTLKGSLQETCFTGKSWLVVRTHCQRAVLATDQASAREVFNIRDSDFPKTQLSTGRQRSCGVGKRYVEGATRELNVLGMGGGTDAFAARSMVFGGV